MLAVALALPLSAVTVRRVHDGGLTAGFALAVIVAPFAISFFFLAVQDMIESRLGFAVPYGLVAIIPSTAAFLFFGLVLIAMLVRKEKTPAGQAAPERARSPWGASRAAFPATPAGKARLEAERHLSGMTTALMTAFGPEASAGDHAVSAGRAEADAGVSVACMIVLDLCAYYGHGIYAPPFDKLFAEIGQKLEAAGWRAVPDGGPAIDLENRACASLLRDHAGELRNPKADTLAGDLLRAEKDRIAARDGKAAEWPHLTAWHTLGRAGGATFIAVEKLQTSYADTCLRIRIALGEKDGAAAMTLLRSATLYESFRHSFCDRPPPYPAFANRVIDAMAPIRGRDGLGISLTITDLGADGVRKLEDRGLSHPHCYVDFEMHERMM